MSWSCPHYYYPDDYCYKTRGKCHPGKNGCVLHGQGKWARLEDFDAEEESKKPCILLVDEDSDRRLQAVNAVGSIDYHIRQEESITEAIRILEEDGSFNLVIFSGVQFDSLSALVSAMQIDMILLVEIIDIEDDLKQAGDGNHLREIIPLNAGPWRDKLRIVVYNKFSTKD